MPAQIYKFAHPHRTSQQTYFRYVSKNFPSFLCRCNKEGTYAALWTNLRESLGKNYETKIPAWIIQNVQKAFRLALFLWRNISSPLAGDTVTPYSNKNNTCLRAAANKENSSSSERNFWGNAFWTLNANNPLSPYCWCFFLWYLRTEERWSNIALNKSVNPSFSNRPSFHPKQHFRMNINFYRIWVNSRVQ